MLEVKDINFSYSRSGPQVLHDISFTLEQGRCMAVLGNNGVGKSTLLKCLDRILPANKGAVCIDGQNVYSLSNQKLAQNIAYVPQRAESANLTVFDAVLLGRKPYIKWDASSEDRSIVMEVLDKLSLSHLAMRKLSQLSGGEAQKVSLARALAQQPGLLLLDEPTSNLDLHNQHEVLSTVRKLSRESGLRVCIIIHDLNLALRYCDSFLFLKEGKVYSCGGPEVFTAETVEQVYRIHVHIIEHMGVRVVVPFPEEVPAPGHLPE